MAFPSSPVNNQLATVNGITFTYNSTKGAWLRASTAGANLTANSLTITSNTVSVSTTSGALLVTGGAGIQGNLNIGGRLTVGTGIVSAANVTSAAFTPLLLQSNAGVTAVTIDTSQNVGIGTSSPSTYGKLGIVTADGAAGVVASGATGMLRMYGYTSGAGGAYIDSANAAQSAYLPIQINGLYSVFATGGTERMRIDSSGNVGIGTSPAAKVEVFGGTLGTISGNSIELQRLTVTNSNGSPLRFYQYRNANGTDWTTSSTRIQQRIDVTDMGYIEFNPINANQGIAFGTTNAERMRIDPSGNVLIGYTTTNGVYKLQVNSQIFATSATIATSDQNYKTNVSPITNALSVVQSLNPVTFNWKPHAVHNFDLVNAQPGFLAQEVQIALADKPYVDSIVKTNQTTLPDGTPEQFLGIAEGNMIAILVAAIKELKAEFDDYKANHP